MYCTMARLFKGCAGTEFDVQGLSPHAEYLFRVAAVNANGVGEYLTSTSSVVAKYPFGKLLVFAAESVRNHRHQSRRLA